MANPRAAEKKGFEDQSQRFLFIEVFAVEKPQSQEAVNQAHEQA